MLRFGTSLGSKLPRIVGGVIVFAVVSFGLVIWQFNRPPFDLSKLNQLEAGMTHEQVRQILGAPQSTDEASWQYSRPMAWPIVYVRFDLSGRMLTYVYDY